MGTSLARGPHRHDPFGSRAAVNHHVMDHFDHGQMSILLGEADHHRANRAPCNPQRAK